MVDTDVISFLFKSHSLAPAYQAILAGRPVAVSVMTIAEIEYGMEAKQWGSPRRALMRHFLDQFSILVPDWDTACSWAKIKRDCEKKGRPIHYADCWIAAAATQMNVPLVTHNAADYTAVDGLVVLTSGE